MGLSWECVMASKHSWGGDAKNPEGVSIETLTLSGFPTRWNSEPRRVGLPVSSRSDLSVSSVRSGVAPDPEAAP